MIRAKETTHIALAMATAFTFAACAGPPADTAEDDAGDAVGMTDAEVDAASAAEEQMDAAAVAVVPAGTRITFVIDETLSTDDADPGQMFDAHVADPVDARDGSVAIPAGAAARGIVIEATDDGPNGQAALIVRLETVELNGHMVPIEGTVVSADTEVSEEDTGAETAGKIAIGAAAGAIIGQLIGRDTESTLAGAGAGAIAGAVIALTTRDGDATLPEGSTVVVRLDQPLRAN